MSDIKQEQKSETTPESSKPEPKPVPPPPPPPIPPTAKKDLTVIIKSLKGLSNLKK